MKKLRAGGAALAVLAVFYLTSVHYTDVNQVAIVWNPWSGQLWLDERAGFTATPPWALAARIDTRPARVCLTTTARAYRCKLVQFEPRFYREFVRTQGFRYYWWANRASFNFGYDEEYRGMRDILRGYAFGAQRYPFLTILNDYVEP